MACGAHPSLQGGSCCLHAHTLPLAAPEADCLVLWGLASASIRQTCWQILHLQQSCATAAIGLLWACGAAFITAIT